MKKHTKTVTFFLSSMRGGGAERVCLNLFPEFLARGYAIDLLLVSAEGPYLSKVPDSVRVLSPFSPTKKYFRTIGMLPWLFWYVCRRRPRAFYSHLTRNNVVTGILKILCAYAITKFIVVEHNTFSRAHRNDSFKNKMIPFLMQLLYQRLDAVVGVSVGVARDLERTLKLPSQSVSVIYNPVPVHLIRERAQEEITDNFFDVTADYVVSVGRLTKQKNFTLLVKSFALIKDEFLNAKLLILGEGEERESLNNLIKELDLQTRVQLPGFVENPFYYMSRARVFVLSSDWEGFAMVLVEALAVGAPVISTDCPHGPREILCDGKYGTLVPIGVRNKLAGALREAMSGNYTNDIDDANLTRFHVSTITDRYIELFEEIKV